MLTFVCSATFVFASLIAQSIAAGDGGASIWNGIYRNGGQSRWESACEGTPRFLDEFQAVALHACAASYSVLDACCGTGRDTSLLFLAGCPAVSAVDVSDVALECAVARVKALIDSGATSSTSPSSVSTTSTTLPPRFGQFNLAWMGPRALPGNHFDLVWDRACHHVIRNKEKYLFAVSHSLRAGALFVMATFGEAVMAARLDAAHLDVVWSVENDDDENDVSCPPLPQSEHRRRLYVLRKRCVAADEACVSLPPWAASRDALLANSTKRVRKQWTAAVDAVQCDSVWRDAADQEVQTGHHMGIAAQERRPTSSRHGGAEDDDDDLGVVFDEPAHDRRASRKHANGDARVNEKQRKTVDKKKDSKGKKKAKPSRDDDVKVAHEGKKKAVRQ